MTNQTDPIAVLRDKVSARLIETCAARGLPSTGIVAYVLHGRYPGAFLEAALSNDLFKAYTYGISIHGSRPPETDLHAWGYVITNCVPADAKGSREAVDRWAGHRGMEGLS